MVHAEHLEMILLVDDDDLVRSVVKRMLEMKGYGIVEACNGQDGLFRLQTGADPVDLLLTDVCMPVLGGRELAEGARKLQPNIKIIFMSGQHQEFTHEDFGDEKIAFLQKPFSPAALINEVRQTLDCQRRLAATA